MSLFPIEGGQVTNPLLSQVLHGWEPWDDQVRFPVTFAVEQETEQVLALRMVPLCLDAILPVLSALPGSLAVFDGGGTIVENLPRHHENYLLCPARLLPRLGIPFELVHFDRFPTDERELSAMPSSVLQAPERALVSGTHYALSIEDACHGVLFSRDPTLVRACLASFLRYFQTSLLGRTAELPALPESLLDPLMEPTEPGVFREVRFYPRRRYWSMEFFTLLAGARQPLGETLRWVCEGEHGRWRDGWSW